MLTRQMNINWVVRDFYEKSRGKVEMKNWPKEKEYSTLHLLSLIGFFLVRKVMVSSSSQIACVL